MDAVVRGIFTHFPEGESVALVILAIAAVWFVRLFTPQIGDILRDRLDYSLEKLRLQMDRDAMAGEEYFRRQDFELRKSRELTEAYFRRQDAREESQGEFYLPWSPPQIVRVPARRGRNGRRTEQAPPGQA